MTGGKSTRRRVLFGVGTLVGLAGCAGLVGDEPNRTPTPWDEPQETTTTRPETPTETSSPTETEAEGPGYKENHWHGRLFLEIDGDLVDFAHPKYHLETIEDDRPEAVYFHFHETAHGPNEWSNEKRIVTFERALNLLPGIRYHQRSGEHVVTYEGTTYDASRPSVTVSVHRGTERIDPPTYEVQHDDNFWVAVRTDDGAESAAEERTGKLVVDVNNHRLDFGAEPYRLAGSDRFEFRDDGNPYTWYNAGDPVTLAHALGTLPDVVYDQDSDGGHVITYEGDGQLGGTYHEAADATQIIVRQRTAPVDPTTYELRNGDIVWVYVHTSNAPDNEH